MSLSADLTRLQRPHHSPWGFGHRPVLNWTTAFTLTLTWASPSRLKEGLDTEISKF